jgi:KaiC/GvpD/RAD55 family RecA-like ATPase
MSDTRQQGIVLGRPLDDLLNRKCVGGDPHRGILLPCGDEPWSGNIVICGRAGSGKSTLALQIARACTLDENGFAAGYISLEEGSEGVQRKAKGFGWQGSLREAQHLHSIEDAASPEDLARLLADIMTKPPAGKKPDTTCLVEAASQWKESQGSLPAACPCRKTHDRRYPLRKNRGESCQDRNLRLTPYVWLFALSPASLVTAREQGALFQERYRQLERLLAAAWTLNEKAADGRPFLPLVCVDSLNVFGSDEPVREEYHRLFDLFHRHEIIGVFTVEAGRDTPFDSTMADVVIRLTTTEDQGYVVQYLEVEKSRYLAQSPGRHTFKILSPDKHPRSGGKAQGRDDVP